MLTIPYIVHAPKATRRYLRALSRSYCSVYYRSKGWQGTLRFNMVSLIRVRVAECSRTFPFLIVFNTRQPIQYFFDLGFRPARK